MNLLLPFALLVLVAGVGGQERSPSRAPWSERVRELAATLPVQDGGRVKPLDTFAQFRMLRFNGKRTLKLPDGEKLTPTPWLLDCYFYPELARGYRHFLVRDSAVLEAIGVRVEGRKKSDRYSYDELASGREKLLAEGGRINVIEAAKRTRLEGQLYTLAINVRDFEDLLQTLAFTRAELPTHEAPRLAARFGAEPLRGLSAFLVGVPGLRESFESEVATLPEEEQEVEHSALEDVSRAFSEAVHLSSSVALFPPAVLSDEEWMRLDGAVDHAASGEPEITALLAGWEALERAKGDPAAFEREFEDLHGSTTRLAARRGEYGKIPLEVRFYQGDYFTRALALFLAGLLALLVSWLAPRTRWLTSGAFWLSALATVFVVVGVTLRCIIRERPPVSTLYETILFVTGCGTIVLLLIERVQRGGIALSLTPLLGAAGMFLAMKYELKEAASSNDTMPSLVAVLDTNFWLATHVTTITLGYAAGLVAALLGNRWLLGKMLGFRRGDKDYYRAQTRMIYGVVCFGLIFSVVGTILGGIWANYSWGRFWGWDPKENGALLICLAELLILHLRLGGYIRDFGLAVMSALNGMTVVFSWWHVNLLNIGLHSYGFTDGLASILMGYYAISLLVVVAALVWRFRNARREAEPAVQTQG
jgi:ABC-type transport system involved in cytochrome c biogenesis permease subunit